MHLLRLNAGLLALGLALGPAPATAQPLPTKNLAYTETFVLYLAGRLGYRLELQQRAAGLKLDDEAWYPRRADYRMLYRRHLIACGGPLPQLAEVFKHFDPDAAQPFGSLAALEEVSQQEPAMHQIVEPWLARIQQRWQAEFDSHEWQLQPACVDAGYARQNPGLGMPGGQ